MTASRALPMMNAVKRAVLRVEGAGLPDETLLREYVTRRDESAFAAVVRRHGPMVLGVCRRVLRNNHDAEDAFQATFLVLALKARTLAKPEQLGNWLYGVAWRTSLEARTAVARRRRKEAAVATTTEPAMNAVASDHDLRAVLDRELASLPEKYRSAIVLCDLEGWSRKDAARQLRLNEGTLSSRLATGRRLLGTRLARRGLRLSATALVALVAQEALARVPHQLARNVVEAARALAEDSTLATIATAQVESLTRKVVQAMYVNQLKTPLIVAAVGTLLLIGGLVGLAQAPTKPGAGPGFGTGAGGGPGSRGLLNGFPVYANAKAYVQRDGDSSLKLRAEIPMGRFLKLVDADGQQVHVHEFANYQPPVFKVDFSDVRVFDTRGKSRPVEDWAKGLKEETLVLMEFRSGEVDPQQLAEAFRLYRDDLAVLIVASSVWDKVDKSRAFSPAKSLPQVFPGSVPGPGGPIPPKPTAK